MINYGKYFDLIGNDCVCTYSNLFAITQNTKINHIAVVLLSKIIDIALHEHDICIVSNAYLADFMRVKPRTIDKYLRELEDYGLIARYKAKMPPYYNTVRCIQPVYVMICDLMVEGGVDADKDCEHG